MKSRQTVFLACSGGVDSTTALALYLSKGFEVYPCFFAYPSKHNSMEFEAAERVVDYYRIKHLELCKCLTIVDTRVLFKGFHSSLICDHMDVPEEEYPKTEVASTVVPGRNLIFSSILIAKAESLSRKRFGEDAKYDPIIVSLGIHAGDHAVYPDCTPQFALNLHEIASTSSGGRVVVDAPFLNIEKSEIIKRGQELGVPYILTRSCYNGSEVPCGKCATCRERAEAFEKNGMKDPLL